MIDALSDDEAISPRQILEELDRAIVEHLRWLKEWHRAVLCGGTGAGDASLSAPDAFGRFGAWYLRNQHKRLLDQPAMRNLAALHSEARERSRALMAAAKAGRPLPEDGYDAFMDTSAAFIAQARRVERAFQAASSDLDTLTGVHNRKAMARDLERERLRALRSGRPCCIGIADLDRFKAINDRHGHAAGDRVLKAAAECFLRSLRPYDLVYRYGGEEFLFCLPDADTNAARDILERLRQELHASPVSVGAAEPLAVSASFGITQMDADTTVDAAIARADAALYRAKEAGRDRVCVFGEEGAEGQES